MVLKLLILVQIWKQHEEGNFIAIILTPHLSKLIKYWQLYGASKVKSTHFHCCSKSYWPYWLAQYYGGFFEPLITSCADFFCNSILLISQCMEMKRWLSLHFICIHTSIAQFGSILSCICILASSLPIRQRRWFIINFTMLKERELFFIWHLYAELPT